MVFSNWRDGWSSVLNEGDDLRDWYSLLFAKKSVSIFALLVAFTFARRYTVLIQPAGEELDPSFGVQAIDTATVEKRRFPSGKKWWSILLYAMWALFCYVPCVGNGEIETGCLDRLANGYNIFYEMLNAAGVWWCVWYHYIWTYV